MEKLVRKNVFETNSSSCHSITIDNSNGVYNNVPKVDNEGNVFINSGEFGWEIEDYQDFGSKASYLSVYIRDWSNENKDKFKEIFESVLKEVTGCEKVEYEEDFWKQEERSYESDGKIKTYFSSLGDGYIDHQSVEDRDLDYMFENTQTMKDFLFSSNSILQTDHDNH